MIPDTQGGYYTGTPNAPASLNKLVWVQLTGFDGIHYSWQEVVYTPAGYTAVDGGKFGTLKIWPAFATNNKVLDVGIIVPIQRSFLDPVYDWKWVIIDGDSITAIPPNDPTPGGPDFGGEAIWANCTLSGTLVTVEANSLIPVVLRLSQGNFIFLFAVDFILPQNYTWSYNAGTANDNFKEVTRTSSSVTVATQTGDDPTGYFGIDVHGTFEEPGSGSGTPGDAAWYCMEPPGETKVPQDCEPLAIPDRLYAVVTNRLGGDPPGTPVGCENLYGQTVTMAYRGFTAPNKHQWRGSRRTAGPNGVCSVFINLNIYAVVDDEGNTSCMPALSGTFVWPGGTETISLLGNEITANAGFSLGIPTNIVFETTENDDLDAGKYTISDTL